MSLQLWEDGWAERVPKKMLAAVLLSGCGSVISSRRQFVSVWQNLPMHVVGYSGIMALFASELLPRPKLFHAFGGGNAPLTHTRIPPHFDAQLCRRL